MTASDEPSPTARQPVRSVAQRSFPLVALLQLATCWAALIVCIDGKRLADAAAQAGREPWVAVTVAALSAGAGGALGFIVGLGQLRMWRSAAAGAAVGALYALVVAAIYAAPAPLERAAAAASMILITTIALRIASP